VRGNDDTPWDICPDATQITQEFDCTDWPEWRVDKCTHSWHAGIDLGGGIDGKPVYATRDADVVAMDDPSHPITLCPASGGGTIHEPYLGPLAVCLKIQEPGRTVYLEYGHLSESTVKPGDRVTVGQVLGKVGNRGSSCGAHLHVEARLDGAFQSNDHHQVIDPEPYLRGGADMTPEEHDWLKHLVGFLDNEVGPNFKSFQDTTQRVSQLASDIAALRQDVASLKAEIATVASKAQQP